MLSKSTKEALLPMRNHNKKRHRFPRSLSPSNSGKTGVSVQTLHGKMERSSLMEEAKEKRESDRKQG